ncbi:ATP-binding protein [Aquincola tertiaricarbonis]|uniref:histidine kinase n=1 Tax=Aquincola tertiaricarbonis TaxID=391953 RepID=A0ABY4SCY8_AQUTE|nr:ATP-binding protein [Aquincola tertiaricarbonis]URI10035.1 ATP-binding protein [Aquincola tertiaricarbonis]
MIRGLRRWCADTLFKRLFLLLWATLVVSHLAAFSVSTGWLWRTDAPAGPMPTLPSLPPMDLEPPPMAGGPPGARPGARPEGPPGSHADRRPGPPPAGDGPPPERPHLLVLDYGVRLLLIGLCAWWGARWLSAPVRRLVEASRQLGAVVGRPGATLPRLDEARGTVEVREAAHVFNEMAQQLDESFRHRGLLMAAISHDLRTPLTRIRLRLESLGPEDDRVRRCVADVTEMDTLLEDALALFRGLGTPEPTQPTDITALVESLCDDAVELGQPVSFQRADDAAATAPAQPVALRRVVGNLLSNAVRYGGRVEVAVQRQGDQVVITVDDEGPGIPEQALKAVFEPFHRLESSRNRASGGSGLGLYIARDLAQRQGASVSLSNRPQGGLRAEVRLPA